MFIFFNTAIIICVLVLVNHMDNWKIEKQSVISKLESMVQRKEYFDSICEKYKSPTRCKSISNSLCYSKYVCFQDRIQRPLQNISTKTPLFTICFEGYIK